MGVEEFFQGEKTEEELELAFLDNIGQFQVGYAAAVHDSVFKFNAKDVWNTNHVVSSVSQLRQHHAPAKDKLCDFAGITTPYIYYGNAGTSFALHIEDLALWSCNYNTGPGSKVWYVVPPSWYSYLKAAVEGILKINTCRHPIQHKTTFVHPQFFQEHEIPYTRVG